MDATSLANVLASRFQAVVPAGFHVEAEGEMLWFSVDKGVGYWGGSAGTYAVRDFLAKVEAPFDWRVATAAEFALNDLQDFVDEESTEPWPGQHTPPVAHSAVRGGMLYIWFGDEGSEDLALLPVELDADY
jgi:hypothetical protein